MEERPVYSYIPKNLNYTGGLFGGTVDTRRLIEGIIGATIAYGLYRLLSSYIKSEMLIYICAVLGVFLFGAALFGGNGEPLSVFLFNFVNYENRRIFVTLRPPMPDFGQKKAPQPDPESETSGKGGAALLRARIDRILRREKAK